MIARALRWVVRLIGGRTLIALLLLLLMLGTTAQAIAVLVPALDLGSLYAVVLVGIGVSWLLARTRMQGWLAVPLMHLAGLVVILDEIGHLSAELPNLIIELRDIDQRLHWWPLRNYVEWQPLLGTLNTILAGLIVLLLRLRDWLAALLSGHATFDPVAASLAWCLALWIVSTWAAWGMRRQRQALQATLPTLILLTVIYAYTGEDALLLVPLVLAMLLLMAVAHHDALERHWKAAGIDYSEDIRFDTVLYVTPISVLLVGLAWFAPAISVQDIARKVENLLQSPAVQPVQSLPNSLGLKPKPPLEQPVTVETAPGLPRSLLIGSGPELSHEAVMVISTGDLPPMPNYAGVPMPTPPRYYWRYATYDHYTGAGWVTSPAQSTEQPAGTAAISNTVLAQRLVRQKVTLQTDLGGQVIHAGTLVAADREMNIEWRTNRDQFSAVFPQPTDVYWVDSYVSTASAAELRATTNVYPGWIKDRYLQLPANTPQRVLALADDLTATAPTPYDRAVAIETYLRTFSYTLDLPAPPVGRDVADYFLFDLKRGYCDYFATTMVVLARAAGLPARLVVGYATGTYNPVDAEYMVSQADAHSWPEVYFNQYGWVEFEPTSGRAPIDRAANAEAGRESVRRLEPLQLHYSLTDELNRLLPVLGLLVLVLLVPGWFGYDMWRLRHMPPHETIERVYLRLRLQSRWLNVDSMPGETAHEYASSLVQCVSGLASTHTRQSVLQSTSQDMDRFVDLYDRSTYSSQHADAIDRYLALQVWLRLRMRLWLVWLWHIRSIVWHGHR